MENIYEIKNVSKSFPGVLALSDVSFSIRKGEVHALVGENGAGKSTLMKILSGVYTPDNGHLYYKGNEVHFKRPSDAQALGISIIHQEFSLIPHLSAVDNIYLGREVMKKNGLLDKQKMRNNAIEVLNKLDAVIDVDKPISRLSVANQQFVEIAKAIAIDTEVLIFDEPTASLTGKEIEKLFELINRLKSEGVSIIYISHHLDELFRIADTVTCLRDGEWVGTQSITELTKQSIVKMMVGREVNNNYPPKRNVEERSNEVLLDVRKLSNKYVKDISFELKKGEILGISGLVGAGRTETVRALIGADPTSIKDIYFEGEKIKIKSPTDALNHGIGLIPESRKTQGLVLGMTVKDNITLSIMNKITSKIGLIQKKVESSNVQASIKELTIKTPSMNQLVRNLSGGNQQKVVLAKWLNTKCKVLIFDEPTRGIDIGAKEEIYKLMRALADKGIAIIMISSELPEVLGMSDRVIAMYKGAMVAEIDGYEIDSEKVMYYATGGAI